MLGTESVEEVVKEVVEEVWVTGERSWGVGGAFLHRRAAATTLVQD
jgi:hypothetical protein